MRLRFTARADKDYAKLPANIRKAFAKQLRFLLANIQHPSLNAKKYSEAEDLWQGRVTRGWRFYFKIERRRIHRGRHHSAPVKASAGAEFC